MNEVYALIKLNPDVAYRKEVIRQIKANDGYCITQLGKTPENKCHCKHMKETGECYCGLFISVPVIEVG